jgi:hypothetical protein
MGLFASRPHLATAAIEAATPMQATVWFIVSLRLPQLSILACSTNFRHKCSVGFLHHCHNPPQFGVGMLAGMEYCLTLLWTTVMYGYREIVS